MKNAIYIRVEVNMICLNSDKLENMTALFNLSLWDKKNFSLA